jgi:predicted lactoylglutathione lyase
VIDHFNLPVMDIAVSARFYAPLLIGTALAAASGCKRSA